MRQLTDGFSVLIGHWLGGRDVEADKYLLNPFLNSLNDTLQVSCDPSQPVLVLTLWSAKAIIVPHQIIWSWYTGHWWMGCYIGYSEEGTGWGRSPPGPRLAVSKVNCQIQLWWEILPDCLRCKLPFDIWYSAQPVYQSPYCCVMVRCSAVLMCPLHG